MDNSSIVLNEIMMSKMSLFPLIIDFSRLLARMYSSNIQVYEVGRLN